MDMQQQNPPELAVDDPIERWLNSVSEGSRRTYTCYLLKFLRWTGYNQYELLAKAKADVVWADELVKKYYWTLKEDGSSSNSRSLAYYSIRSFFTWNHLRLGRTPRAFVGRVTYESGRVYTQEEMSRIVDASMGFRNKAVSAVIALSAQRDALLAALRWGMIRAQVEKGGIVLVEAPGEFLNGKGRNVNKTGLPYRFAWGSDATRYVQLMMKERMEGGEPINDRSWLFRSHTVRRGKLLLKLPKNEPGHALTGQGINKIFEEAAQRAGLQEYTHTNLGARRAVFHAHGCRRYMKERFRVAFRGEIDVEFLDFILGEKVQYDGAYDKFSASYVREMYAKAEPYLSINEATVVKKELDKANRENMDLRLKYLELMEEIQTMNRKIEELSLERKKEHLKGA